jgi:hypothetical protein
LVQAQASTTLATNHASTSNGCRKVVSSFTNSIGLISPARKMPML